MIPVKQQFKHAPEDGVYGDCHRAAIATVLGLPLCDVPHFGDGDPEPAEFFRRESEFLGRFNLRSVQVPFLDDLSAVLRFAALVNGEDLVYLLGGTSRTGVHHSVVCQGDRIVHDPSPSDTGIVGPCKDGAYWITVFAVRDPMQHVHGSANVAGAGRNEALKS